MGSEGGSSPRGGLGARGAARNRPEGGARAAAPDAGSGIVPMHRRGPRCPEPCPNGDISVRDLTPAECERVFAAVPGLDRDTEFRMSGYCGHVWRVGARRALGYFEGIIFHVLPGPMGMAGPPAGS